MEIKLKKMARGQVVKGYTCPAEDYIGGLESEDQEDKTFQNAAKTTAVHMVDHKSQAS